MKEGALPRGIKEREIMPALRDKELGHESPAAGDEFEQGPVNGVDSGASFKKIAAREGVLGHGAF